MQVDKLPRFSLAQLPTPVEKLERLSRELDGPELLIKRNDQGRREIARKGQSVALSNGALRLVGKGSTDATSAKHQSWVEAAGSFFRCARIFLPIGRPFEVEFSLCIIS